MSQVPEPGIDGGLALVGRMLADGAGVRELADTIRLVRDEVGREPIRREAARAEILTLLERHGRDPGEVDSLLAPFDHVHEIMERLLAVFRDFRPPFDNDPNAWLRTWDPQHDQMLTALRDDLFPQLEQAYASEYGPLTGWQEAGPLDWSERIRVIEWPSGDDGWHERDNDGFLKWSERGEHAAHYEAARAYRRACGWDFAPGPHGTWLTANRPVTCVGGGDENGRRHYRANLVGFLILVDRENTGAPRSIAHVWTAGLARNGGVARRLITEARARYPTIDTVEGPFTEAGRALIRAVAPDLLANLPAR